MVVDKDRGDHGVSTRKHQGSEAEHVPHFLWLPGHHQFQLHPEGGQGVRPGQTYAHRHTERLR